MRLTLTTDAEEERGSGSCRAGWRGRRRWQMAAELAQIPHPTRRPRIRRHGCASTLCTALPSRHRPSLHGSGLDPWLAAGPSSRQRGPSMGSYQHHLLHAVAGGSAAWAKRDLGEKRSEE